MWLKVQRTVKDRGFVFFFLICVWCDCMCECVCVCHSAHTEIRDLTWGVGSFLLVCLCWGLNSGRQAWPKTTSTAEASPFPHTRELLAFLDPISASKAVELQEASGLGIYVNTGILTHVLRLTWKHSLNNVFQKTEGLEILGDWTPAGMARKVLIRVRNQ